MNVKKEQAEITIAQAIGEVRQLMLWQTLTMNPALSFKRAQEIAEEEVQELFDKLENGYREYFSEK